jgi:hypothetical protein
LFPASIANSPFPASAQALFFYNARLQLIYSFSSYCSVDQPIFLFFYRLSNSQQEHKLRVAISAHPHVWPQKLAIWETLTSFTSRYNRRRSTETKPATNKPNIWCNIGNNSGLNTVVGLFKADDER